MGQCVKVRHYIQIHDRSEFYQGLSLEFHTNYYMQLFLGNSKTFSGEFCINKGCLNRRCVTACRRFNHLKAHSTASYKNAMKLQSGL